MAARGLKERISVRPRLRALALLALAVLVLHFGLGAWVQGLEERWVEMAAMPPRMAVSYVREMPQAKPVPAPQRPRTRSLPAPTEAAAATQAEVTAPPSVPELPSLQPLPELPPTDSEPGPEWPLSTRLRYELTGNYRGPVTGEASVEWARQGRRYQVHLDASIGPSFAPLLTRSMNSEGVLTPDGIAPERYDEETRVLFTTQRRSVILFKSDGTIQFPDGRSEVVARGAQDSASQFVHLTWLFLTGREAARLGHAVELPLVLPKRQYAWRYEVVGEVDLITPLGRVATWHLIPTRVAGSGDLTAEIWLAPSLQFMPVRLVIRQDANTYIDLMLKEPPMQEASIVAPTTKE